MTECWKNRELTAGISLWFTSSPVLFVCLFVFLPSSIWTAQLSGVLGMQGTPFNGITRNWWRLRLKTLIKWEQKMRVCTISTHCERDRENFFGFASPKIARIFNYCRRFFLLSVFASSTVWSRSSILVPNSDCKCFEPFFRLASILLNRILETSKECSSWVEGKSFRVCRINWIDCWHGKGNSYWKRWTYGNWKFPSTNSPPKKNNDHAIGLDSKNFVYTFALREQKQRWSEMDKQQLIGRVNENCRW